MTDLISLVVVDQEPRVDSRIVAKQLGVDHKATHQLILRYQSDLEEFGILPFQMEEIKGRGQPAKFALLNEDQSYLLLTYSQNTEQARDLKKRLVRSFGEHRRALTNLQPQPALPKKRVIKTRDDLSFTRRDEQGRLQNWVVPHDRQANWHIGFATGQAYLAEIQELALHHLDEARLALQWALSEGAAPNFQPGGWGIEYGFAQAIAQALFPIPEEPPKKLTGRKAKGAAA